MRGEKSMVFFNSCALQGSSPRARGKVYSNIFPVGAEGIIPACAGKRPSCVFRGRSCKDHPRVRGEKDVCNVKTIHNIGSSPRARGKAEFAHKRPKATGIIPACAGKRCESHFITSPSWDHPRVRGEKISSIGGFGGVKGSSPRARGKGSCARLRSQRCRIIPACAGKS